MNIKEKYHCEVCGSSINHEDEKKYNGTCCIQCWAKKQTLTYDGKNE